jgi:hypothetical protein
MVKRNAAGAIRKARKALLFGRRLRPYTVAMLRAANLALCALVLTACSVHPPMDVDPLGAAPENFTLDMTILTGPGADSHAEAHLKQSRMVLLPDGTLRYGVDAERTLGANWLPNVARRLSRQQVAEVWALARQLGLTDPARGDEPTNFALITAKPDEIVYLLELTGGDDAWQFVRTSFAPSQPDPAMTALARRLAQLAWASDFDESKVVVMPKRYNFGPDPYSRYRSPQTAPAP